MEFRRNVPETLENKGVTKTVRTKTGVVLSILCGQ